MRKYYVLAMLFCMPFFMSGQEEEKKPDYVMYQDVHIVVKPGSQMAFEKAVLAHNEKYHKENPHQATLFRIASGTKVGSYVWSMGPLTYTDLDSRPGGAEHGENWAATVGPHIKYVKNVEYWRYGKNLSYKSENQEENSRYIMWFFDLEEGQWETFKAFMEKVRDINKKMDDTYSIWWNQFGENNGRGVSMSFGFSKWADLDEDDWNMSEEYDKEHGEGAWEKALKDWNVSTGPVSEEVWEVVKK